MNTKNGHVQKAKNAVLYRKLELNKLTLIVKLKKHDITDSIYRNIGILETPYDKWWYGEGRGFF